MNFLDPDLDQYVVDFTEPEPPLLQELSRETWLKILVPQMISGHLQGRVISALSKMIRPKRLLEIGTFTGYSAICWSEGLDPEGTLITLEMNEELEDMIRSYFDRAGITDRVDLKIGNAMDLIAQTDGPFDVVFIDADKVNYGNYYDMVFDKVSPGGYIVADNVLWSGKILQEPDAMDPDTRALYDYSRKVHEDDRVENVMFPIRDGLMIARKK